MSATTYAGDAAVLQEDMRNGDSSPRSPINHEVKSQSRQFIHGLDAVVVCVTL